MPHIRLRKDGRFEAVISFKGKQFSVYSRDKQELNIKITKKVKDLQQQYKKEKTLAETKKDWITLKDYYTEWLEQDKKPFVKPRTLELIESSFKIHILPKLATIKLNTLNKAIIQKLLNDMPKSRAKEIATNYLKACLTQAYKEGLMERNPFDTIRVDKKIKFNKKALTSEKQLILIERLKDLDNKLYIITLLYLCLGIRRNEIKSIEKANIKEKHILIKGTKTENAERYINITPQLKVLILKNLETIKNTSTDYYARRIKKIFVELNIDASVHTLRHTFATNHYYLKTPVKQVQVWLGHSSIQVTLDIYTNLNPTIEPKEEKEKIKKIYNNLYYYSD